MIFSIILSILKIIGITLLCILGIVLFIICIVLFVPIRYKVTADANMNEENKEYHLNASVSWLLHLVYGNYNYPQGEGFVLKVGPFTVMGGKKKSKKKTKQNIKKNTKKTKEEASSENRKALEEIENIVNTEKLGEIDSFEDNKDDTAILEEMLEEETNQKKQRKSIKEKIRYTWTKICDKIKEIWQKIKGIFKNIKKYVHILKSEEFKSAFSLCKDSIVRLFCMIKPRKVKIKGKIGFKDPEQTGYMCAAVGVISPYFQNQIQITPDFEQYVINGKAFIKGRIYLVVVLIIAIKIFFDKNIRKVLDMFHKEES